MACTVLHADAFEDNYIWLVTANRPDKGTERPAVIIDPGDEDPVFDLIRKEKLTPIAVMCTHHHWDHVGGAADIADRFDIPVYGPADENISAISNPVTDGDSVSFPELQLTPSAVAASPYFQKSSSSSLNFFVKKSLVSD